MININGKRVFDVNERWEDGIEHREESIKLYAVIAEIDFKHCDDSMGLKSGGDGDNGEHLMYLFDIYFDSRR